MSIPQLQEGTLLGDRYLLREQIGLGGTGAVFAALDRLTGDKVAVKVLRRALADDPVSNTRFQREMNAMAMLRHPNVVPLLDHGVIGGGLPYIVMPWIEGPTLWVRLRRKGPMPVTEVRDVLFPLCSALSAVHRAGMVHRDIKSANVILSPERGPQLLDLGLVHEDEVTALTAPGHACGTPEYMAPERITGAMADHRSDLYSLGIMVFEMLTATLPYTSSKRLDILRAQVRAPVPNPSEMVQGLPRSIAAVTARFMAKEPKARPMTALAMARDFEAAAAGSGDWAALRDRLAGAVVPEGRVVVLGASARAWEEIPMLFELYEVEAFRADELEEAAALLDASPRAVLWCAAPLSLEHLLESLSKLRAMPRHVVLADDEAVSILLRTGIQAIYCPPGLPLAEFLRTARALFGHRRAD